jgi:NADH-quinone oxidoreductase subunit L
MAAPTPVSALLHAATMVTAGIFLLLRITTDIQWQQSIVATSGAFTIVFGGYLAVLATDIKQIIAYSTTSQLG